MGWVSLHEAFTDAHEQAAREVLDGLGGAAAVAAAVLSGSRAAGLGHANSDLDVYVVPRAGAQVENRSHRVDGHVVQIEVVDPGRMARLAGLAERFVATSADRSQLGLDDGDLILIVRLTIGRRLLADPEHERLLARFDRGTVRKILVGAHAIRVASLLEDVDGSLRSGDWFTAVMASGMALEAAVEAALYATGDLYLGRKFLLRRLARSSALAPSADRLYDLVVRGVDDGADPTEVERLAVERSLAANHLVGWAVLGWDEERDGFPPLPAAGGDGPVRSPWFSLLRFADGIAMAGPDLGFRVNEATAQLWLALDGRRLRTVAGDLASDGGPAPTPDDLDRYVDTFRSRGAVLPEPSVVPHP